MSGDRISSLGPGVRKWMAEREGASAAETGALAGSQDKEGEFKMGVCPQQQGPVIRNGTESQSMELEQNDFNFLQMNLEKWLRRGPGEGAGRA